jgi:hypothetical protein
METKFCEIRPHQGGSRYVVMCGKLTVRYDKLEEAIGYATSAFKAAEIRVFDERGNIVQHIKPKGRERARPGK